jgi:hypothetical protein
LYYYTPQLHGVYPTASFGGTTINLYGIPVTTNIGDGLRDMGDIRDLELGDDLCSRFGVNQTSFANPDGQAYNYLTCLQSSTQEANKYNVTERVIYGTANNDPFMRRTSFYAT